MSSFRVIHHTPRIRDPRLDPRSYPPLEDRFHPTFPSDANTFGVPGFSRKSDQWSEGTYSQDLISRLPVEFSDLIFSKLTPDGLDAARYTCHEWWCRIMPRSWVLSTVLGPDRATIATHSPSTQASVSVSGQPQPQLSATNSDLPGDARLRRLVRSFNGAVCHSSMWRLQYRKRSLLFRLPESHNFCRGGSLPWRIIGTASCTRSAFLAFLVQEPSQYESGPKPHHRDKKVLIYKLCQSGPPLYVGSKQCYSDSGPFKITDVSKQEWSWELDVQVGPERYLCKVRSSKAFGRDDAAFNPVWSRELPCPVEQLSPHWESPVSSSPADHWARGWKLISPLATAQACR